MTRSILKSAIAQGAVPKAIDWLAQRFAIAVLGGRAIAQGAVPKAIAGRISERMITAIGCTLVFTVCGARLVGNSINRSLTG